MGEAGHRRKRLIEQFDHLDVTAASSFKVRSTGLPETALIVIASSIMKVVRMLTLAEQRRQRRRQLAKNASTVDVA